MDEKHHNQRFKTYMKQHVLEVEKSKIKLPAHFLVHRYFLGLFLFPLMDYRHGDGHDQWENSTIFL